MGIIGGGGSVLTIPILVYLLGITPVLATAYSLFIVGATAIVGAISYARDKMISFKTALVFGVPSIIAVFLTRKMLIPALPENIFGLLSKDALIMLVFSLLMLGASVSMIRGRKGKQENSLDNLHFNYPRIIFQGFLVGFYTGFVGAGGGFLIIPVLVLLVGLPMKAAIGTSLLIISGKSLIGFLGDIGQQEMDWFFLISFTALSILGIFIGSFVAKKIDNKMLKPIFGYFVLLMAIYIMIKELI